MSVALDPKRSVTLLASAGTGKTWALTARIVRLLLTGAAPGSILALTFTRKAAAEMRERVAARLQDLAFADDTRLIALLREIGAADDAETCAKARELFEAYTYAETPLRASTLHVFCAEVLRRFALEAEVPAGFALLENERARRGEAIESVLRRAHRDREGVLSQALDVLAADGLSEFDLRGLLRNLFEHRAEIWAATEGHAAPLDLLSEQLATALPYSADEDPYGAIDTPAFGFYLKELYGLLHECSDTQYIKHKALEPALDTQGEPRLTTLLAALYKKDGSAPFKLSMSKRFSPAQAEATQRNHAAVLAALMQVVETQKAAATYRRSRAALTLGLAALDAFAEALRRSHQLGFAELEWQTLRLLRKQGSAEWVRYKLDQQLQHVLLDEFQDTSPTQWRLLLPLLEEFAAQGSSSRTVFLVGDGKQSIYGFRRAEPRLLQIAGDWLRTQLNAGTESLDESRRSAPAVIDFVNALFAGDAGASIDYPPHRTALSALYGSVEIAPLILADEKPKAANDPALRNPLTTPREVGEDRRALEEAGWVADRIAQLIDRETPVTARDGSTRAMQFGDVMVLARHRTHVGVIEKALGASGIPYTSATRGTLLDTAIARDLLALLAVLDSPHLDLDLAHALRSPLFSASDADLLWLAAAAQSHRHSWFEVLATADAPEPLARAHALLSRWRTLSQQLPPHDLIDRIASESDLLRRCRAARPHDTLLGANLAALLQLALDNDHGRYPTLGGFLQDCAALAEGDGPDEAPPPSSEARVRVMTVHAAKGLEAPAVFLVNTAPSPRNTQGGWRVDWPAADERPRLIVHAGRAEQREALSARLIEVEQARETREALNLLYVAVTRAQQYLFVSGFQSGKGMQEQSWHARCRMALIALVPSAAEDSRQLAQYHIGSVPAIDQPAPLRAVAAALDARLLRPLPASALLLSRAGPAHSGAALRGQVVHAALQHLSQQPTLAIAALQNRIEQQLGLSLPLPLWQQAYAEARSVLAAPGLAALFNPDCKAWNEVPLWVAGPDGMQVNVLDRLVDTGEALWIIDYKTHRSGSAAELLDGAREQLLRYVAAVRRIYPLRSVHAALVWTPTATLLELPLP